MSFDNRPDTWDKLLDIVGRHWLPMVASGCIRDWTLGVPAKDVDIVVPAHDDVDFISIIEGLEPQFAQGEIIYIARQCITEQETYDNYEHQISDYERDENAPDLVAVWEGEIIGIPVNIIGRASIEPLTTGETFHSRAARLCDTFDFNVVKFAYAGAVLDGWYNCEESRKDIANLTCTLAHNKTREQSLARFKRFNDRNPGLLRFVDKPGFIGDLF